MPKSACNRCGQNIEYDASYEGHEVACPGCDNITLLRSNEPDRSIPVATPIPSPGTAIPTATAVPAPPASTAQGPRTLPPGAPVSAPEPEPEPEPVVKAVTSADRIAPASLADDDEDDALPAKFKPGPRRKVAPPRRPARQAAAPSPPPPPPPPPAPPVG